MKGSITVEAIKRLSGVAGVMLSGYLEQQDYAILTTGKSQKMHVGFMKESKVLLGRLKVISIEPKFATEAHNESGTIRAGLNRILAMSETYS